MYLVLCTEFFNGNVIVPFSPMCAVLYTFILIFSKHLYIKIKRKL